VGCGLADEVVQRVSREEPTYSPVTGGPGYTMVANENAGPIGTGSNYPAGPTSGPRKLRQMMFSGYSTPRPPYVCWSTERKLVIGLTKSASDPKRK